MIALRVIPDFFESRTLGRCQCNIGKIVLLLGEFVAKIR